MNEASAAFERAVQSAQRRAAIVRAVKTWEAWVIIGAVLYFAARILPWSAAGFPIVWN